MKLLARLRRAATRERPLRDVPAPVLVLLVAALAAQLAWHQWRAPPTAHAAELPAPASLTVLRAAALGEPLVLSRLLMLWLQSFDNQPGVSIPFSRLDYARVLAWLDRILALDPLGRYPLLAASRVYGGVPDPERQRVMFEWVYQRFLEDPDRRWPWLAHAAIVARHRLGDLPLALHYAQAITERATGPAVPAWARDMSVVLLQDMGEVEAARILIGGLLDSGRVSDPHEIRYLVQKLEELDPDPEAPGAGTAADPAR